VFLPLFFVSSSIRLARRGATMSMIGGLGRKKCRFLWGDYSYGKAKSLFKAFTGHSLDQTGSL